jgi:hypothetical protein
MGFETRLEFRGISADRLGRVDVLRCVCTPSCRIAAAHLPSMGFGAGLCVRVLATPGLGFQFLASLLS